MKKYVAILILTTALAPATRAAVFEQLQPQKSSVEFSYSQMGVPLDGRFRKFSGQLRFDPARPEAASVAIEVDLASIDTGTPELDAEAAGQDWFNLKSFPVARFAATGVTPLGANRYSVPGKLTIKGRTRDVVVPATFTAQGSTGVFTGQFTIHRGDFSIGEGAWAAADVVANDVTVRFQMTISAR